MTFAKFWKNRFGRRGPRFESHLRKIREEAGLTPQDLADHCQVSRETIELIEEAQYEPSIVLAEHLSRRLDVPVESIFTAHAPAPGRSADFEERLYLKTRRAGYWSFAGYFALSLIAANVLFQYTNDEIGGMVIFGIWAVVTIAFLIATTRIPGYWRYLRKRNQEGTPKKIFWMQIIISPIIFATLMVLMLEKNHSLGHRVLSFFYYALFWGGSMYWLQYRKSKRERR
ncbi:MAG TPA: helix-turn-helix domain-containing protein [Candidatus Kapabacteria bacterium]|nr:helix-turn-helix domain-containing protein [Candidatus Kapabacteria bacterium]